MTGILENKVTLDVRRPGVQARLLVRQGDALVHKIKIALVQSGRGLITGNGVWATVTAELPDGGAVSQDCTRCADGTFEFTPGAGFFTESGPVVCRLTLRSADGAEMYSPAFAFDAESTFDSDSAPVAEAYSKVAELLTRVEKLREECEEICAECEEIADSVGDTATVKNSVTTRDHILIYNTATGDLERIPWSSLRTVIRSYVDGNVYSAGMVDEANTGYVAIIPELEDDDYIVVGREHEALAARVAALEEKVTA